MATMTLDQLQALVEQQGAQLAALQTAAAAETPLPTEYYTLSQTGETVDAAIRRAMAGGAIDIALAGKAPSGYGLGTRFAAANMIADANAATVIGWYRVGSGTANYNRGYGDMLVDAIASNQMLQTVYQAEGNILQRRCISGTWDDDWAYVNPPLALNTEYRTVEWYQGNPVYVKLISYTTASPGAGTYINVPHGITNLNHIVRYTGYSKNYPIPYFASSGAYTALQSLSSTNLVFANVGNTGWGTSTWYITLYYTKTA